MQSHGTPLGIPISHGDSTASHRSLGPNLFLLSAELETVDLKLSLLCPTIFKTPENANFPEALFFLFASSPGDLISSYSFNFHYKAGCSQISVWIAALFREPALPITLGTSSFHTLLHISYVQAAVAGVSRASVLGKE